MPVECFMFQDLATMFPKVVASINRHVRLASNDCADRSSDTAPRVITIQLEVVPEAEQDGSCARANMLIKVKSTVPPHRSATVSLGLRNDGVLLINLDSLQNIDQGSFSHADD